LPDGAVDPNVITEPEVTAPEGKKSRPAWRELPFLFALAIVLALLIKALLIQAFSIPSGSMMHTLEVRDRVLVNKLIYDVRDIHRGEIVVFNGIDDWAPEAPGTTPRSTIGKGFHRVGTFFGVVSDDKDYIKRVIGLPGDRVMCCSPAGNVVVQAPGKQPVELHEPYLLDAADEQDPNKWFCAAGHDQAACPPGSEGLLVPKGRLWVMGDHRGESADSRFHYTDSHQGTIPVNRVVGRAFVVVYPLSRAGALTVPDTFTTALARPGAVYLLGGAAALPITLVRRRRKTRAQP
jgi:signal peptidase I